MGEGKFCELCGGTQEIETVRHEGTEINLCAGICWEGVEVRKVDPKAVFELDWVFGGNVVFA